jgi:hypothetical protein
MKLTRPSFGMMLLVVILAVLLGFAVWGFTEAWKLGGDTHMGVNGWIAMGLAAVLTLALGGGLMWLAFYSSRHGYDDDQNG